MSNSIIVSPERLLTPGEVAELFRVDAKTVYRWATEGKLSTQRTLGGHRRFMESEVMALLLSSHRSATKAPAAHVGYVL